MSMFPIADSSNRAVWLNARKSYVTASAVASILGCGFQSRKELLAIKLGRREEESLDGLAMIEAGKFTERGVLDWFAAESPHGAFRANSILYGNPRFPRMAATPDAIMDGLPIDCKIACLTTWANWTEYGTDRKGWPSELPFPFPCEVVTRFAPFNPRIAKASLGTPRGEYRSAAVTLYEARKQLGRLCAPLKYVCQIAVQMAICDAPEGWLTVCIGGVNRIDFRYKRDYIFEAVWLRAAEEFIAEVEAEGGFK